MNKLSIVALEIVEGCNLYCSFCARNASNKHKTYIEGEKVKKFLDILKKIDSQPSVAFTGGEPLLHPKICEILEETINKEFAFSITTNASVIKDELFEICRKTNLFKGFIISLDSYNEIIHDEIRGKKGTYKDVLKFIKRIKLLDLKFSINMTVNKENYKDVDKTILFAKEIGARDISIATVKPNGRGKATLSLTELSLIAEQIKKNQNLISEDFQIFATEITFFLYDMENYREAIANNEKWRCSFADRTLHIKLNGDIQGCATCNYLLGNIFDKEFDMAKFWKDNEILNLVRDKENLLGECRKCKYRDFCGGCRCRAYAMTGELMGDDLYCPLLNKKNYEKFY